jgi:eukaryotic-like serine/threonine-protein kinase
MDTNRLARIDELFDAVLELEPARRERVLAERCPDPAMRREVETLLAAADAGAGPLDRRAGALEDPLPPPDRRAGALEDPLPLRDRDADAVAPASGAPVPARIGPYRPLREIGRGGMAVVYVAERVDGHFDQTVALKLIPGGTDCREVIARFERERQILASLDHPSIARLLDGGVSGDGRPYFAMELVEGLPLDQHCDRHRLTVEERLRLFCDVARALDFAHHRLVLHRDLKPSNILVTADGRVKLLDFGIATVLEREDRTQQRTAGGWLTPAYASPEQIRGAAMSTASDVYQLGLLLYELLTGRRPYEVRSKAPSEAERVICEVAPTRPSHALREQPGGGGWSPQAAAERRRTTPGRLAHRLDGDLDLILLQCLRKEPQRRYPSAEALAHDLEAHLAGLPVSAHPDSLAYRAGKFARRHRAGLAAASLLAALGAWHVGVVLHQSGVVRAERDRARAEAAKASAIQEFLLDLFQNANPAESLGEDVTVRQALDRGAPRIAAAFPDQPEVRAELLGVTGEIYRSLGLHDQADEAFQRALAAAGEAGASDSPLLRAAALGRLGTLRRVQSELAEAEALLREALELRTRELGEDHPEVAELLDALGATLSEQRRQDDAEPLLLRALGIRRAAHGELHDDVAATLTNLAEVALDRDDFARAEELSRQSLEIREAILPADHPALGKARSRLSRVLVRLDRLDEAEELQHQVVEANLRVLGADHPDTAISLSNLGQLQHQKGDLDEAAATLRRALEIRRREAAPNRAFLAASWNDLGLVLRDAGDLVTAETHFRTALAEIPADHPWRRVFAFNLAGALRPLGRYREATAMMREILASDLEIFGPDHTAVAVARWELGLGLVALGERREAEALLDEARRIYDAAYPQGNPLIDRLDAYRADLLRETGRLEQAAALATPALERLRERYGDASHHTARAALVLGRIQLARDRPEEAGPLLEAARPVLEPRGGPDAETLGSALGELARARGTS